MIDDDESLLCQLFGRSPVQPGHVLTPNDRTRKSREFLNIPCPTTMLVLRNLPKRYVQVLVTYPDSSCETQVYDVRHLTECYEVQTFLDCDMVVP